MRADGLLLGRTDIPGSPARRRGSVQSVTVGTVVIATSIVSVSNPARMGSGDMRVRLLGPVDAEVDGLPRPVHGLRRKAILAVLALRCGEVVSADQLIDVVWAGAAPPT